ncbi:SH3 domain-containing protein [Methylobacillus caricis]|uniref:SH3 domain-containing protein n=1 Tax=Methylobacillus caricis TaxID=1971611 RepID=UPI001CFF5B55|nr:SH3 domain-containing protein [Methylobacillus caricis]MCB5188497.1 SH3 domain-containing protein [Methylobacillus caricis]
MAQLRTKLTNAAWVAFACIPMLLPAVASALEFRSISVPKAVLYDAPSAQGKKTFILGQGYPVEVIVNLGDWLKVRDAQGGLNWVEAQQLATKRTVLVKGVQADLRQTADASSTLLGRLDKDVVLDMLEPPVNGWIKVKHRDGLTGYVLSSSLWGF